MKNNQGIYTGIDVFKLIAAIFIVLLHTIETTDYFACGVKFIFTPFAVPFFFIASGFFFCKGLEKAEGKKYYFYKCEKNIMKIFLVWSIIYGPFVISDYIRNNQSGGTFGIVLLLIRRFFIIGAGPYWYLVALMWSAAFLYLCYIMKKEWIIKTAIIIGLILQVTYTCFRGILSNISLFKCFFDLIYTVFSWEFNFIMYGIPFMGIGFYIYKKI